MDSASARERGWALPGEAGDDLRVDTKGHVLALFLRKSLELAKTSRSLPTDIYRDRYCCDLEYCDPDFIWAQSDPEYRPPFPEFLGCRDHSSVG